MEQLVQLIQVGIQKGYSDIHITGGHPTVYRRQGSIQFDNSIKLSHQQVDDLVKQLLDVREMEILRTRKSVDVARTFERIRVRVNVFTTARGLSLAVRLLAGRAPTIDILNLHPSIRDYCKAPSGLILVCGTTGSGKSTTIAAMIEEINKTRSSHIISIEDPVEYRFLSKQSFVEQRELGPHTPSFERGLLDVLREDPDVIVVGEVREPETIRLTLNAAEAGHLVIASLHATNSEDAIHRICNSFPAEAQEMVRIQLSSTITLLLVQRLIMNQKAGFRIPILSIMTGAQAIKGLIRENRLSQIESTIQTGKDYGMMTMEQYDRDYLSKREHFNDPMVTFQPSAESTAEIVYNSPLLERELSVDPPIKTEQSVIHGKKSILEQAPVAATVSPDIYTIEEEKSMGEIIEEIKRIHSSGPTKAS
jgi:twitching motility protein PilT